MSVGGNIRTLRIAKGMTQEELGKSIGTTKQNIYKYEKGIVENIPFRRLRKLAAVFEVPLAELIE